MFKKLAATGLLAFAFTGAALTAAAPASAGGGDVTGNGNSGVLNGNQVIVPVTVCGNTVQVIAALNDAFSLCGGASGGHH